MIGAPNTSLQDDLNAYPNVLVVEFRPRNLPSGMVNFHDLAQVIQGLQEILEEVPLREFGAESRSGSQQSSVRLIAFSAAEGSYKLTVTLQSIIEYVFKTLHMQAPSRLDPEEFLKLSAQASIVDGDTVVAADAARELYRVERARLQHTITLLNDVRESDLKPVSGYITPKLKTALRRLRDIFNDSAYPFSEEPSTIGTDQNALPRVSMDGRFIEGVNRTADKKAQGPHVRAYGKIIAWHSEVPYFNLTVAHFGRIVQCKYGAPLDQRVRELAVGKSLVVVEGRAYYEGEASDASPPAYIVVQRVHAVLHNPPHTYIELTQKPRIPHAERAAVGRPVQSSLWDAHQFEEVQ